MSYIDKEKLIKADIASIENRVRHAFNQGYDLGFKDGKEKAKPLEQEPTTKNDKVDCEHTDCNNCVNHKYCDYESNCSEIPTGSTTKNDLADDKHKEHLLDIMDSMPDDTCGDWRDSLAYAIDTMRKYKMQAERLKANYDKIIHLMKCGALHDIDTGRLDGKCEDVIPLEDAIAIIDLVYKAKR